MADDNWDEDFEPSGLTLGPEKRLEREVAKSKALKVERLQLRDQIARLEEQVERLEREMASLRDHSESDPIPAQSASDTPCADGIFSNCWVIGGIVAVLISVALLWFRGIF